jgi:nitrite transporter NirC
MYSETIETLGKLADAKAAAMRRSPGGFFVASMLAGAYIGMGILLILTLGSDVPSPFRKLVMGATFGIALTLVVIAGGELFTGYAMLMPLRHWRGGRRLRELAAAWGTTWIGNLLGALVLVALFALGGGGGLLASPDTLVMSIAAAKMGAGAVTLVARGVLCNWLVCLAIWMAARVSSESAKCIVVWWCLFAFIACGFEHSVANMTVFGLALAGHHPETVSVAGAAWNLGWVTLGNVIGGALFVAGAYWSATHGFARRAPAGAAREVAPAKAAAGD